MSLKVRAVQRGFYDNVLRRVGDVFTLTDDRQFSSKWMQPVPDATREQRMSGQNAVNAVHDDGPLGQVRRVVWPVEEEAGGCLCEWDPFTSK